MRLAVEKRIIDSFHHSAEWLHDLQPADRMAWAP